MANKSPGLFGICPKKSLSLLIVLISFSLALAIPLTSALGFDNVKDSIDTHGKGFDVGNKKLEHNPIWKTYAPLQIKNFFGYGKTLFRGAITKHTSVCSHDCSSTMQIHLTEDSVLIDDVDFYTIKDDGSQIKQDIRGYQFYIDNKPYSLGTEVKAGTYEVRLDGQKSPKRSVDWVIKTQGKTLGDWATWGGNYFEGTEYQLIILADSVDEAGLSINGVTVNETSTGAWKLNATGTVTASKNKIMKVLFYGTDGSDPRATSTYITNPTAVYSNNVTDDGRRGYYVQYVKIGGANDVNVSYTATFADTSTNTNCLVGGYASSGGNTGYSHDVKVEYPSGTMITGGTSMPEGTSDDDTSNPTYKDNQPNMRLLFYTRGVGGSASCTLRAYILAKGTISYSQAGPSGGCTPTTTDFYTAESFPIITYLNAYTELNTPADDYISDNETVNFNCTAYTAGGATLTNITLWHNVTGTWASNQTNDRTGTMNSTTFNLTLTDGEYVDWTCQAGDSDGDSGFAISNRTFSIDISPTLINITYPEMVWDYGVEGNNITLNWTVSDTNLESCWFEYNNTNTSVTCTDENATFILDSQPNITFYANDSVGHEANYTRTWVYKLFGNLESYNLTAYETATEGFRINITATGSQTILANLSYNGTIYLATKVGNGTYMEFYKDFGGLPAIATATVTNHTFFWEVWYGTQNINTTENNQSVGRVIFGLCNATLTTSYINFTFEDEETAISTNATIDSSTWYYWLGDGTVNKSLLYSTTTANESYGFCFTPTDKTMENTIVLQYSDTGYPQRRWTSTTDLTNTTTNQKLYMLASADGTYSVYQVQTATGSSLSGVRVQAERQFSGVWTLVEEGTTDSAGGFTAWLNPDYDHRLTFTKSGYVSQQVTVRPSSSTYTIVMSGGEETATYNSSMEGLSWKIYPGLGKLLLPNTTQIFLFNITANLSNIVSCKMEIINNNSVSLGTTTGCNSQGGNLSLSIPLGTNRSVRGVYSVNIGDGYFIIDSDAYWIIMETDILERGTIVAFFKYARNLNEFGSDDNRQEYSRVVFFFLMLSIIMGSICYSTGWDFSTGGGAMVFLTFIIIMASYSGFLTLSYTGEPGNPWMDRHVVALITSLFTAGFVLNKMAREA